MAVYHDLLIQGSKEWDHWRNRKLPNGFHCISSTKAAIIHGPNVANRTAADLWLELEGRKKPAAVSKFQKRIFDHGHRTEPIARRALSKSVGVEFSPCCAENSSHRFQIASLDGISRDRRTACEIKCPVSERVFRDFTIAGAVPAVYYGQVLWIFAVCDEVQTVYFSMFFHGRLSTVRLERAALVKDIETLRAKVTHFVSSIAAGAVPFGATLAKEALMLSRTRRQIAVLERVAEEYDARLAARAGSAAKTFLGPCTITRVNKGWALDHGVLAGFYGIGQDDMKAALDEGVKETWDVAGLLGALDITPEMYQSLKERFCVKEIDPGLVVKSLGMTVEDVRAAGAMVGGTETCRISIVDDVMDLIEAEGVLHLEDDSQG